LLEHEVARAATSASSSQLPVRRRRVIAR
jgi:hypothetical protein